MVSKADLSALECLDSHSPNLRILRLNRAVNLEKLPDILRHASQLVEFDVGAYFAGRKFDPIGVEINVSNAFSDCYQIEGLSGFWEAVPDYFPLIYPVHQRVTSLKISHATIRIPDYGKMIRHFYKLRQLLVLDYIYDSGLEDIATYCKDLEERSVFPYAQEPDESLTVRGL